MILDSLLFSNLDIIGKKLLQEAGLKGTPRNIYEMKIFLEYLNTSITSNDFKSIVIANILFSFVSDIKVRDRNTTARTFEDFFSALFGEESTDASSRINPEPADDIQKFDYLCNGLDWKISTDLAGNKREKTDLFIKDYGISLKTLKGQVYNIDGTIVDNDVNSELNIGSLSYRALLKGIISDEKLNTLSDRKSGLGSARQLRDNIFNPILELGKQNEFYERLNLFMNYVYEDDVYIVLKSHYRIDFILIPNKTFLTAIYKIYKEKENTFEKVFYRWENNNLRLNWIVLLRYIREFDLEYFRININLNNINKNPDFNLMKDVLENDIRNYLEKNI
ncbi:MAG: hypothetical protein IKE91_02675 [Clostridia bacterium]|nr:hypothetical protein [Clostridia bacterium]